MDNLLQKEDINDFYIINNSGGMIYSLLGGDNNKKMVFCSTISSIYDIAITINTIEPKPISGSKLSFKNLTYAVRSEEWDDKTHFKLVFISTTQSITVFKTVTDMLFVFVGNRDASYDLFTQCYSYYSKNVVLDPFYNYNQPIKKIK